MIYERDFLFKKIATSFTVKSKFRFEKSKLRLKKSKFRFEKLKLRLKKSKFRFEKSKLMFIKSKFMCSLCSNSHIEG